MDESRKWCMGEKGMGREGMRMGMEGMDVMGMHGPHGPPSMEMMGPMDMMSMMNHVFMKAKMKVLKEKMMKRIEAKEGKKLDAAADLIVDHMLEHFQGKMERMGKKKELMEKLKDIFMEE